MMNSVSLYQLHQIENNLRFYSWVIMSDSELNFQMTSSNIQEIDFSYCGNNQKNQWKAHPERFINIITSIRKCQVLANSLMYLNFNYCMLTKEYIMKILKENLLSHIKVGKVVNAHF